MTTDFQQYRPGVVAVWLSGNVVDRVSLHQAGLVLRWVTISGYTVLLRINALSTTQPGHPFVGRRNDWVLAMITATAMEETVSPV